MTYAIIAVGYLILLGLLMLFVKGAGLKTPQMQIEEDNEQYEWLQMLARK